MIDFILQHHGTTLVEYFYHRAKEQQKEADPSAEEVDEATLGAPIEDLVLQPGELLYLPRGYPHVAQSTGEAASP